MGSYALLNRTAPNTRNIEMHHLALAALLVLSSVALAQEGDGPVKKQKDAAAENLKIVNLAMTATAETDAILVYTTLPEAKAKLYAAAAQKAFDATYKLLKVEDKGKLWPGKLTVYVLPTRTNYNSFVRLVLKDRPEGGESHRISGKGDTPMILIGTEPGVAVTDASVSEELSLAVAKLTLLRKFGTSSTQPEVPFWLTEGFSKVAVLRMEGNATKLNAYRNKLRSLFAKKSVGTFKVDEVWGMEKQKDRDLLAASFVEYLLATGDKFEKFVTAFNPGEGNQTPTVNNALEAIDCKDITVFDAQWKSWVSKNLNK